MSQGLENRIPPPLMMLATGGAMYLVSRSTAMMSLSGTFRWGAVTLYLLVAAATAVPAFRAFGKAGTTINPVKIDAASQLVTGGIYRVTRNPMYVGLTALLLALAVALSSPWTLLGPVFFVLFITRFQIIPEERVMQAKFGDAFTAYRQAVRRWL